MYIQYCAHFEIESMWNWGDTEVWSKWNRSGTGVNSKWNTSKWYQSEIEVNHPFPQTSFPTSAGLIGICIDGASPPHPTPPSIGEPIISWVSESISKPIKLTT
jgi:hypothetical protein